MDLERELEAERRRSGRLLSREEMSRPEDAATAESYIEYEAELEAAMRAAEEQGEGGACPSGPCSSSPASTPPPSTPTRHEKPPAPRRLCDAAPIESPL